MTNMLGHDFVMTRLSSEQQAPRFIDPRIFSSHNEEMPTDQLFNPLKNEDDKDNAKKNSFSTESWKNENQDNDHAARKAFGMTYLNSGEQRLQWKPFLGDHSFEFTLPPLFQEQNHQPIDSTIQSPFSLNVQ